MHLSPGFAALRWALPLALPLLVAGLDDVGDAPRRYEYTITWDKGSPDGFEREMAFVNGQFPGPLIEANQGDNVEIVVTNNMPMNTTIHFHGITQIGTPWSDGVPGLTQRYIQPGKSFTYKWKADQYESYWYHAHSRGQIDDGLYGPILINGNGQENCWSRTKINQLTTGIQRVFCGVAEITSGKQKLRRQQAPPVPAPTQPAVSPTSTPYINDAGAAASRNVNYFSQQAQRNYPAEPISQNALNDTIYPASADDAPTPILFGPPQTKDENDVTISTQNNTWIDLILESAIFPMPPHPNSVAEAARTRPQSFNLQNPPKRDTFQSLVAVGQPAWIAVRYHSSDPGPWLMHCHIQAHLEGGMAMVIQDGVDAWPQVPSEYLEMS
ncbi:hypothetical protein RB597_009376 [Gaeumannomyces tritici]